MEGVSTWMRAPGSESGVGAAEQVAVTGSEREQRLAARPRGLSHAQGYRPEVAGWLRLGFGYERTTGRSRLLVQEQRPPLQVVRAFSTDEGGALVHVHNLSGGVLGGDRCALEIEVGPGARVMLTSTGATRLYRPRAEDRPALQRWQVHVGAGALLEHLPDALIPFAGARYRQEVLISLAEDAGLFWWEIVAPGRVARGECFAYEWLELLFTISRGEFPLALERFRLEPQQRSPGTLARLGPFRYCASLYVCRTGQPRQRWADLEAELAGLAQELSQSGACLWGVSRLVADGLVVRGLAQEGLPLSAGLPQFWRLARLRLYGRTLPLPRKIT
ncbi:urease accessory protein UreD [Thermogemmatispora sp.]|uniref:urease accessory protein UreD n=1 Tax=Thermogemmatispora sp. TaxID=1968838 RepID=UPI001DB98EC5|nr:urease accessory protein UreD [Thermogemmatispora sp.]MBX5451221.1 urease accessory protein UreD [Thermogemmatispora sp.]